jgi:hypothetical protein
MFCRSTITANIVTGSKLHSLSIDLVQTESALDQLFTKITQVINTSSNTSVHLKGIQHTVSYDSSPQTFSFSENITVR